MRRCNAASARRDSSSRPRRARREPETRPKKRRATGLPAHLCRVVPVMTRSSRGARRAAVMRGEAGPVVSSIKRDVKGRRHSSHSSDGVDKVPGAPIFGADMKMPGMLWGKIKRPAATCRIVSINTDKAMALPRRQGGGTRRADVPGHQEDRRVSEPRRIICGTWRATAWPGASLRGHAVAAVAAISRRRRRGARLIAVE